MFKRPLPFALDAVASSGRLLKLQCISTHSELDYSVLHLLGDRESDAFFDVPAHSNVSPSLSLGLVGMGHSVKPPYSVHAVTVSSCDAGGALFCYDGAAAWAGGSGAALLFEEGCVVGMHQEVLDDKPEVVSPTVAEAKRVRGQDQEARHSQVEDDQLERGVVASSSPRHAKVCRALLLSHVYEAMDEALAKAALWRS
jgi:hypothetical protein